MGKLLYTNPKFKTISEEKYEIRAKQRQILKNKMFKKEKKLAKRQGLFQYDESIPDPEAVYE